ncbi:MAG: ABC transporter substrate-binding protein [Parasporobacterium sp.]|nr:ABC transporter substrate-binding protein [Parasporobacterium sp.]
MKKFLCVILALAMAAALAACGGQNNGSTDGGEQPAPAESQAPAASAEFTVGICQLVTHDALDAATQGFKDALTEALGDRVAFLEGNAAGDSATCSTICNGYVSDGVDLIMANATPALQAAASATADIPVLGTSVSSYAAAFNLTDFDGTLGTNVSGTSDLAPMDVQAQMVKELFPEAKTVGILYCSGEANSVFQVEAMAKYLTELGFVVNSYSFADSNDVAMVTGTACDEVDVIYIPTDNTAASCAEAIEGVVGPANKPVVAGEEGICKICGVATLTINYYDLGVATGKMAARILNDGEDISTMAVEYFPDPVKKYNPELAEKFGLTIPEDYVPFE